MLGRSCGVEVGAKILNKVTSSKSEFSGKTILVTGAGRGLGKRFALAFARLGARIALLSRSKAELDLAHIEIEQAGGNAIRIRADVTDPEQLTLAVERARVGFGHPVDVLICAAAKLGPLDLFIDSPLNAWAEAIQSNLLAVSGANGGTVCKSYSACSALIKKGTKSIHYEGFAGIGPLNAKHDPSSGYISVYQYVGNNDSKFVNSVRG